MREDEVEPAAMDVDGFAQMAFDHRRAFDMPTRAAAAPGGIPADHAVDARFPHYEVGRVALVRRHLDPCARNHRVAITLAEDAVVEIARHSEEDMPLRFISVAALDQTRD